MIFKRTSSFSTSKSVDNIKQSLVGSTIEVHNLSFEVIDSNTMLKIIPHAENDEKLRILPITHLEFNSGQSGTRVTVKSKPRRIDIGGPNLLVIFCFFTFVCGLWLYIFKAENMQMAAIVMMAIAALVFLIFWLKMQQGYFDYIRKLKAFIKNKVGE